MLSRTVLTISQQAGDDGRLFGSVTNQDIVDAIREARGCKLDRRGVHLEEPIKNVGTYMVVVEVSTASPRRSRRSSAQQVGSGAASRATARARSGGQLVRRRRGPISARAEESRPGARAESRTGVT